MERKERGDKERCIPETAVNDFEKRLKKVATRGGNKRKKKKMTFLFLYLIFILFIFYIYSCKVIQCDSGCSKNSG